MWLERERPQVFILTDGSGRAGQPRIASTSRYLEKFDLRPAPDIIHGQHHAETMTALLHFASVPAVFFFCHGWRPPEEEPPLFPRSARTEAAPSSILYVLVSRLG